MRTVDEVVEKVLGIFSNDYMNEVLVDDTREKIKQEINSLLDEAIAISKAEGK